MSRRPGQSTPQPAQALAEQAPEAVLHLRTAALEGVPWHQALLEAVGLWTLPEEVYKGRTYRYLLQGEALDWLTLAERLCAELDGAISMAEKEDLLFYGRLPRDLSPEEFRGLIGATKHRAFLNYWYGVVVEEGLQLAVEEEVRKRHRARCYPDSEDLVERAFSDIYEDTRINLLEEFARHSGIPPGKDFSLTDLKEFTYWLFKRRIKIWDPARVASDTRKGINKLQQLQHAQPPYLDVNDPFGYLEGGMSA